jgi:molecular chaperone DnaK
MIKDNDEKLSEEIKTEVQADVDALKAALASDDDDAVKTAQEKLMASSQKIGEAVYAAAADAPEEPAANAEDVVDAEVVEDDEKTDGTEEKK